MGKLIEIGVRLKEERERLGKNQNDFSRIGGVNRNSQSAYETGKTPATVEYLTSIESAGVDLGYVLWGSRRSERLTPFETELITCFAAVDDQDQISLLTVAASMAGRARPMPSSVAGSPASLLPPTPALEQMFLGLLRSMPDVSGDELARELAMLLPTGLRTIEGPLRYEATDDRDVDDGGPPYRADADRERQRA